MCVVCPHGYEHLLKPEEDVGAARGGISDSCESPNKYVGNQTERSSRSNCMQFCLRAFPSTLYFYKIIDYLRKLILFLYCRLGYFPNILVNGDLILKDYFLM